MKNVKENDIFILFEIIIDDNANVSFLMLTREFLLIF